MSSEVPKTTTPAAKKKASHVIWEFLDVRGPKAVVLAKIDASDAPEPVKGYLRWRVEEKAFDGVVLNAHGHSHADRDDDFCSVTKLY